MINAKISGLKKLSETLTTLSSIDANALMNNVALTLDSDLMKRFELGQDPSGRKWEESERAIEEGGKTGIDTANLRDSFHAETIGANELMYGSDEKYAAIFHFGGTNGRNHSNVMVARETLGLGTKQLRLVDETIDDFMSELLS